MSIRVIKRGTPPAKKIYTGTCFHCGTVCEAEQGDLAYSSHRNEDYYNHDCPVCNKSISFIPKTVASSRFPDR